METHAEAIAFFLEHGIHATRRVWALGDSVVVPSQPTEPDGSGIVVYAHVAWLVPAEGTTWALVQLVRQWEHRVTYASLDAACAGALRLAEL